MGPRQVERKSALGSLNVPFPPSDAELEACSWQCSFFLAVEIVAFVPLMFSISSILTGPSEKAKNS